MKHQLIPPPELAPPSRLPASSDGEFRAWAQLLDQGDALVRSALQAEIGPNGDLDAAYRAWLSRRHADHDQKQKAFLQRLTQLEAGNGK